MERKIIQVEDKVPVNLLIPLSIQHMFAMFGASVLVPFMFGINPAIVLLMNGIGTLLFILITKVKHRPILVPVLHSCHLDSWLPPNLVSSMLWADLLSSASAV